MLLATMPELSSQEKRVGRHHTRVAHCVRSQQSSYLRFRLQFSGKAAVIAKVRLTWILKFHSERSHHRLPQSLLLTRFAEEPDAPPIVPRSMTAWRVCAFPVS